mmetsp:Transcript_53744/g.135734  ORF Transcript_53744/g.135734 Transcript_53744/m.135734 type:complete len:203 (-) Transcript_53744:228-836(-)
MHMMCGGACCLVPLPWKEHHSLRNLRQALAIHNGRNLLMCWRLKASGGLQRAQQHRFPMLGRSLAPAPPALLHLPRDRDGAVEIPHHRSPPKHGRPTACSASRQQQWRRLNGCQLPACCPATAPPAQLRAPKQSRNRGALQGKSPPKRGRPASCTVLQMQRRRWLESPLPCYCPVTVSPVPQRLLKHSRHREALQGRNPSMR